MRHGFALWAVAGKEGLAVLIAMRLQQQLLNSSGPVTSSAACTTCGCHVLSCQAMQVIPLSHTCVIPV
jgi:hypothetical protein